MTPYTVYRTLYITALSTYRYAAERWRAMPLAERLTTALLVLMISAGVVLRIQGIGSPAYLTFDEQFYAPTSHHFLVGVPDLHDFHPPLGKLFGTIGLLVFGYGSVGWRFIYLCFGLQTMVIGYWLGAEIFQDRRAGWFAAAFMAADGFFIAYSRAALIDGMLTCLVLWSMLAVVAARSWRGVVGAAVLIGLATSIKWSGAMTLIPATAALLVFRRVAWYQIFWFALTPVVHLAIWFAGLHVMGHPTDVASVYGVLKNSFVSLQATGAYDNPLASNWYTWPLLYHPIVVKLSTSGESTRYASSAGNIAFWYPASLLILGLPLLRGVSLLRQGWRRHYARWIDPDFSRAALLLVLGWAALIAMWTLVLGKHRFFYHYMPSYGFAIVLLAGVAARLERRWPRAVFAFVAVAVAVALFFVPVWCEFPLTENQANIRLLPKPWRP